MKKRKKRRSKTEGGDKLPFDDEMGKNQKAIKVLQRLFDAGYGTEKEIVNMTMDTVTLEGLEIGTNYKLSGWQMVKAENEKLLIDGKEVTNDYEFIADKGKMEVQIEFTFDGSTLGGADIG